MRQKRKVFIYEKVHSLVSEIIIMKKKVLLLQLICIVRAVTYKKWKTWGLLLLAKRAFYLGFCSEAKN